LSPAAGSITWAIAPFVPQTPFAIYAGVDAAPVVMADANAIIDAVRSGGNAQFDYIVPAKVRPVIILGGVASGAYDEYITLRLGRLGKYGAKERDAIRAGSDRTLLYVAPATSGLSQESAVMLDSPVRVHRSALAPAPAGAVNAYELRTIQERFVLLHGFDMRSLLPAAKQQYEALQKTA
jgi:hypothetical protein